MEKILSFYYNPLLESLLSQFFKALNFYPTVLMLSFCLTNIILQRQYIDTDQTNDKRKINFRISTFSNDFFAIRITASKHCTVGNKIMVIIWNNLIEEFFKFLLMQTPLNYSMTQKRLEK